MQSLVVKELQNDQAINDSEGWDGRFGDSLFSKGVELLAKQMNRALSVLEAMDINGIASMMARGFLSRLDRNNENSIKSNLRNTVGIDLQGQIRAEGLDQALNIKIAENVALIKSVKDEYKENIGKLLRENVMNGERPSNIVTQIKDIGNVTKSRAKFIARDQTAKANADITQLRAESLGSKTYIWSSTNDERSRPDHDAMDGKLCQWSDPSTYSDDDGKTWKKRSAIGGRHAAGDRRSGLHPGRDFQCRCVSLPIVTWS